MSVSIKGGGPGSHYKGNLFYLPSLVLYFFSKSFPEGLILVLYSGPGPGEILVCDVTHPFEFQDAKDVRLCFGRQSE